MSLSVHSLDYVLPDGSPLLRDVSFRVSAGEKVALIGANGAGKTTLLRLILGELNPVAGTVSRSGEVGVMLQFLDRGTVRDALISTAPSGLREIAARLDRVRGTGLRGTHQQMRYADLLARWGDAGGYDLEVLWDHCAQEALGLPYERCADRPLATLSGGEQKRLFLTALLRGGHGTLLLDEPDNFLDVPGKRWLERELSECAKAVLYVSHDRELLASTATSVVTLELGAAGNAAWVHHGGFRGYRAAREARRERLEERGRRWCEERERLRDLVRAYRDKASYNSDMTSRYRAARTRLARFEREGPPQEPPRRSDIRVGLRGGRTGRRAVICSGVELVGLTDPWSFEARYGDRVGVVGPNGSGKSHFLRLLSGAEVPHRGEARLGARVRPGWFAQAQGRPDLHGRALLDVLHEGEGNREGLPAEEAYWALSRYGLERCARRDFRALSGGQRARFQILLLELEGANLLLLDEPTDNLDLDSAEALQEALRSFRGTVIAVTHDRWFARDCDRFLIFSEDGSVYEADEPRWE
ncbi:ABC-F family ATP-binding cassette domain-containing protein [Corynebacterium mastitidis]